MTFGTLDVVDVLTAFLAGGDGSLIMVRALVYHVIKVWGSGRACMAFFIELRHALSIESS